MLQMESSYRDTLVEVLMSISFRFSYATYDGKKVLKVIMPIYGAQIALKYIRGVVGTIYGIMGVDRLCVLGAMDWLSQKAVDGVEPTVAYTCSLRRRH